MYRAFLTLIFGLGIASAYAQEPKLTVLPGQVTSPQIGIQGGRIGATGREINLAGWLVLNGARFRNSDYPELAQIIAENNAAQDLVSPDREFTQLPNEPFLAKPNGEIVRGWAICPTKALCGDPPGALLPFNLEASL